VGANASVAGSLTWAIRVKVERWVACTMNQIESRFVVVGVCDVKCAGGVRQEARKELDRGQLPADPPCGSLMEHLVNAKGAGTGPTRGTGPN
jgi:hypothetical protein